MAIGTLAYAVDIPPQSLLSMSSIATMLGSFLSNELSKLDQLITQNYLTAVLPASTFQ